MGLGTEHVASGLSRYELGRTAAIACQADQRFSYCLYVPEAYSAGNAAETRVLVALHGSDRGNAALRDLFVPLAEELNLIVLAPLFPIGIAQPYETDNYKYVAYEGIRFDHLVLAMMEEVGSRYRVDVKRVAMFGFSGGAHLSHRFLYLHPERLTAASICAPGSPTILDSSRDWWVGVRDTNERFGIEVDPRKIAEVAIHLAVGLDDKDTSEITHCEESPHWMHGANDAGATRVDRLRTLGESLEANGIGFKADYLASCGHNRDALAASAAEFFRHSFSGQLG